MSRVANSPIPIPSGSEVKINGQEVTVKGNKGTLSWVVHDFVQIGQEGNSILCQPANEDQASEALAGTTRALVQNMVTGTSSGFEKKLVLIGVGYRASMQGKKLVLTLGFSHPVELESPEGITIETPSQTEIVVKGIDKQKVGQVAANIRAYRPPEPYKGKGVRYSDEVVVRKEAKKK